MWPSICANSGRVASAASLAVFTSIVHEWQNRTGPNLARVQVPDVRRARQVRRSNKCSISAPPPHTNHQYSIWRFGLIASDKLLIRCNRVVVFIVTTPRGLQHDRALGQIRKTSSKWWRPSNVGSFRAPMFIQNIFTVVVHDANTARRQRSTKSAYFQLNPFISISFHRWRSQRLARQLIKIRMQLKLGQNKIRERSDRCEMSPRPWRGHLWR